MPKKSSLGLKKHRASLQKLASWIFWRRIQWGSTIFETDLEQWTKGALWWKCAVVWQNHSLFENTPLENLGSSIFLKWALIYNWMFMPLAWVKRDPIWKAHWVSAGLEMWGSVTTDLFTETCYHTWTGAETQKVEKRMKTSKTVR